MGRILPPWKSAVAVGMVVKLASICPPARSFTEADAPSLGNMHQLDTGIEHEQLGHQCVSDLVAARADAKSCPAWRAASTRSSTVLAGKGGWTNRYMGDRPSSDIGAKPVRALCYDAVAVQGGDDGERDVGQQQGVAVRLLVGNIGGRRSWKPAPARFSTMTDCPSAALSSSLIARATDIRAAPAA